MKTCTICYAWRPKHWDKWHWADTEALCDIKNTMTGKNDTCPMCDVVKPKVVATRIGKAVVSTEDELSKWYAENKDHYETTSDSHVEGELYEHQLETIQQFDNCTEMGVFHEQGCGKSATLLNIAANKFKRGEIDRLVIIAPNDVHRQWAREQIPSWLPADVKREVMCFGGRGGSNVFLKFYDPEALHICCVNIDTFSTPTKWMPVTMWANEGKTFIILDEATCIKSVKAKRTERLLYQFNNVQRYGKRIISSEPRSVARAVLTGTPVTNGPMDLWSMFEFLRPNYFGRNWYSFQNYFGMFTSITIDQGGTPRKIDVKLTEENWFAIKEIWNYTEAHEKFGVTTDTFNWIHQQEKYEGPYKHADELKDLIAPISSFKLLAECVDMPKQNYIKKLITMSEEQQRLYYDMENELLAIYQDRMATAANKVTAIIRLQQISSGFLSTKAEELGEDLELLPNDITWIGSSCPKMDALYDDVAESAKPIIIATRFVAEAHRIYEDLRKNYKCCLMTGWKKEGSIDDFKAGKYDVMVANTRVISRGFNLQNSCKLLFYSNTFSLEDRLQLEGRIFRIGQTQPCTYVDYINLDTVDMKIVAALLQKRGLLDYIRGVDLTNFINEQDEVFRIGYAEHYNKDEQVVF